MREFRSVSASQLYDFRDCARLWWFKSVLGLDTPVRTSAELGTAVHAVMQAYLEDGKPPPDTEAGRIFRPAMSLLPPPGTVYTEVTLKDEERSWPRPAIDGTPCNGFVDVLDLVNDGRDYPRVIDLKTTSALKWAKTEAELLVDPQGLIYGKFALDAAEHGGFPSDRVVFGHVVVLTRGGPLAKRTTVTMTRKHVEEHWQNDLVPDVRGMREVARARAPLDVPGNRESCNKYGGCHFRDRCRALGMAVDAEVPGFISRRFADATPSALTPSPSPAMSGVQPAASPRPESPVSEASSAPLNPRDALARLKARRATEAAANGSTHPAVEAARAAEAASKPVEQAQAPAAPPPQTPAAPAAGPGTTSGDAKASILAKYGIKPGSGQPAAEQAPPPAVTPADAPPQVSSLATGGTAQAPAASQTVGDGEAQNANQNGEPGKATRKPPGFLAKLTALGWSPQQIERMNAESMRAAIDGKLEGRGHSVLNNGSIVRPTGAQTQAPPAPAGKPDGTVWFYHAESDSFAALTYEQWNASNEKGLLVHVGDDADKAQVEATLAAMARGDTVEGAGASKRVLDALTARAASEPPPASAAVAQAAPAVAAPSPAPQAQPATVAQPEPAPKLVLYIDCEPAKGRDRDFRVLEDIVQPLFPVAVEMHNRTAKPEERADYYSLIPYNRGPGYVANLLLKNPPTGVILCNTRMPATNACLEVLVPMADVVVRALR